jgi:hypothetical protein
MKITISAPLVHSLKPLTKEYRCDLESLVAVALEEMIAAHQPAKADTAPAPKAAPLKLKAESRKPAQTAGRAYADKPCATCGEDFAPLGPRAKYCARCRNAAPSETVLETVWTPGRNSPSLTGDRTQAGMRF